MAWWRASIAKILLLHAMAGVSRKAHVSVVILLIMRSVGVMSDRVRWCCLNYTVSETWAALVALDAMVWHR